MSIEFRKKPVVVQAIPFVNECDLQTMIQIWGEEFAELVSYDDEENTFTIDHETGVLNVKPGDVVIRGSKKGDFYPCDGDTFEKNYERAVQ